MQPFSAPISDIQKALQAEGLDAWLFYDFRGINTLASRVLRLDPSTPRTRRWFYLIPAEGQPQRLVHAIEPHALDTLPGERTLYATHRSLTTALSSLLKGKKRVAMEYSPKGTVPYVSRVDAGTIELVKAAKGVQVVSSGDLIQTFEATLTPSQLKSHWRSASLLREFVFEAFKMIAKAVQAKSKKNPLSEIEVSQFLVGRFKAHGLTSDHAPIVAFGHHTSDPHYTPSRTASTRIRRGDLILIDIWAKEDRNDGVYADITWMGYAGETVPEKYAKIFKLVRQARDAAARLVEHAASDGRKLHGWQVDEAARNVIAKAGHANHFIHRTGHSIGTDVHGAGANMDNYETKESRRLVPGSLFSIEPGIYQHSFGVRSEIDVYFGDSEAYVTTTPSQSEIVPILKPGALHS